MKLQKMQEMDMWVMEVLDWNEMKEQQGYQCLEMEQSVFSADGKEIITTRCPIRINRKKLFSNKPAPKLGEHNSKIINELNVFSVFK